MRTTESDVSSAVRPDSISISQSDDRAVLVFAEQIRAASVTIPARFVAGAISGILITVVMSREVPFKSLATWLIALYVALGYMLFLYFQYKRAAPTPAQARNWTTRFLFASLLHGSAWGVAGIVMFQSEFTIYQMWLTLALFMVAMAAVTTGTSAFLPLVYAFVLPTISPILIREAIEADFLHWSIMATGIVFVAIIFYLAAKMNDLMVESFNLRFDNELARNRAEEASRAKTRFLASASHDLRQPLHTLSLYSAALKLRAPDGTTGEIAGHIDRAIASLSLLVNSLLDISKLDAGAVQPEPQRVGAKALIERIATDFRPLAAERGLAFQVTAADVQVDTDPVLLERLVRNLVDNAFKYTAAGGVSLAAEGGSDGLRIAVRDTGTGIPAGERERIFEEFYQIANPERDRSQGLGLGLAIEIGRAHV